VTCRQDRDSEGRRCACDEDDDYDWYDAQLGWPIKVSAMAEELKKRRPSETDRSAIAVAVRELKERRNNYAARRDSFAREGAYAEVLASYDTTLAEIDGAIAVLERLRSA
jgi:hypothetical protein